MYTRKDLRMALTAGLSNGFSLLSGVPFGYYMPLAVLACAGGTYGASVELGRQRLLGTVLGGVLLWISFDAFHSLPTTLAIPLTLGLMRLLGGMLKLKAGYKVGGLIVVMGWLVHSTNMRLWISLRLMWTVFGVIITLLNLRLFWPSSSVRLVMGQISGILQTLEAGLTQAVAQLEDTTQQTAISGEQLHQLMRDQLFSVRQVIPSLAGELGDNLERQPMHQLISALMASCSQMSTPIGGLLRQPAVRPELSQMREIHQAERELLSSLAARLRLWQRLLQQPPKRGQLLPPAPQTALAIPEHWLTLYCSLDELDMGALQPRQLERIASRLQRCRQTLRAVQNTERLWIQLAGANAE